MPLTSSEFSKPFPFKHCVFLPYEQIIIFAVIRTLFVSYDSILNIELPWLFYAVFVFFLLFFLFFCFFVFFYWTSVLILHELFIWHWLTSTSTSMSKRNTKHIKYFTQYIYCPDRKAIQHSMLYIRYVLDNVSSKCMKMN